ncbi:rhomboid-related protein 4 isoform X1 [Ictalurus furcatus]|uniref:rhomboid-related protein 4 isoform X1 n=1 Tax=Ictalurus furcatus TaxID=66913 RepID=UPI00234FD915|nr:rhomboid-related protein 4 isoform X1 [Ictalurus furcatus]XP_053502254.1 rhomboid-related protein 4 isoform X1 [Ictalurus furcatus]
MSNRQRGVPLGLLLLASQVFQIGTDNIPPATLVTLILNVYLFLFPFKPLLQTCVSVQQAYWGGDWHRLLFSPFHHVNDLHLYFNMASFLWKGVNLERRLGTAWFAYLLSVFSLLTGLVYLLLEAGLTELLDDSSFSMQCAVGFSGVLFGLKVVNNYYNPGGVKYIMGCPVAKRYACWVELVLIHILNPGTSFVGHLSGILVGLLYITGPLRTLMKTCADFASGHGNYSRPRTYHNSSGYSGYGTPYTPTSSPYSRQGLYNLAEPSAFSQHPYTAGLTEQEQYEAAIRASLQDQGRHAHRKPLPGFRTNSEPNIEEIRHRRLQRFDPKM